MSFSSAIVAGDTETSVTTHDYTQSGFGTPDAGLFLFNICDARGTRDEHALLSIGATDKTNQCFITVNCQDNTENTQIARYGDTSHVMGRYGFSHLGSIVSTAEYNAVVTDGLRVNWDDAESSAWETTAVLFKTDNVKAGTVTLGNQNVATTVTIGFEANVVIVFSNNQTLGTAQGFMNVSGGFVCWDGSTVTQCCSAHSNVDNVGASTPTAYVSTSRCTAQIGTSAVAYTVEASNFTSTSFDLTPRDGNCNDAMCYVAIDTGSNRAWCGVIDTPTSTGTGTSFTGPGWKPGFGVHLMSLVQATGSVATNATAGGFGISAFNATDEASHSITDEDGASTINTSNMVKSVMAYLDADDQTDTFEATLSSFDATGWTPNVSNVIGAGTAMKWPTLMIEEDVAGTVDLVAVVTALSSNAADLKVLRGLIGQSDGQASLQAGASPFVGFSVMVLGQGSVASFMSRQRGVSSVIGGTAIVGTSLSSDRWLTVAIQINSSLSAQLITGSESGEVTLIQSSMATFPDRPSVSGMGMLVSMASGNGSGYVEHDLGVEQSVLHTRVLLNPATVSGGVVVILVGLDQWGVETFRVAYDAENRLVTVKLSTSETLNATLLAGVPWHCIELKIDTVNGESALWLNGISMGSVAGVFTSLATRRLLLGAIIKDVAVTGDLYLDEWVMADGYIGPVVVEPRSLYADDPARWVVIYNSSETDSVAWAENYRQARGVPFANLIGLSLSADETIDLAQWLFLFNSINDYLANNGLDSIALGILIGHLVPGYVDIDGMGFIEAIPALLHHTGSTPLFNPLSADGIPARPTADNLGGFRLTARVDGATLTDAQALVSRSDAIMTNSLGDGSSSTIWFDPYTDPGPGTDPQIESMTNWHASVDRMRMRLPLQLSAASNPQQEVQFSQIDNDGFFWGWSAATPPTEFFGSLSGSRVFCFQLHTASPTGPTLRSVMPTNWMDTAIDAGYAASAGSSRAYSLSAVPFVRPFMEGLRLGWTLAESWFVANPVPGEGLFLIGDPLMTVRTPHAGWDVFGPLSRLEEIESDAPVVALRDDELAVTLTDPQRPLQGEQAYYLIRHLDSQGRSEAGVRLVRVMHNAGLAMVPPLSPIWPDTDGWPVLIENGFARLVVVWDGPVRDRAQTVILEGQIDGGNTQVLQTIDIGSVEAALWVEQTLPAQSARYRWFIQSVNGAAIRTPWSEMIDSSVSFLPSLQIIEGQS